jgi:hypothetical protein
VKYIIDIDNENRSNEMSKPEQLIAAYEAKRASKNKPCTVIYNGNGTYTIKPKNISVPYTVTTAELKAKLAAA